MRERKRDDDFAYKERANDHGQCASLARDEEEEVSGRVGTAGCEVDRREVTFHALTRSKGARGSANGDEVTASAGPENSSSAMSTEKDVV